MIGCSNSASAAARNSDPRLARVPFTSTRTRSRLVPGRILCGNPQPALGSSPRTGFSDNAPRGHGWDGMTEPFFFDRGRGLTVREIAALTQAEPRPGADLDRRITGVASLDRAGRDDLVFLDKPKYAAQLAASDAGACLTTERQANRAPSHMVVLCVREPYRAFVQVTRALFPDALRPSSLFEASGTAVGACVHPTARIESGATVDPGAVIGPRAETG